MKKAILVISVILTATLMFGCKPDLSAGTDGTNNSSDAVSVSSDIGSSEDTSSDITSVAYSSTPEAKKSSSTDSSKPPKKPTSSKPAPSSSAPKLKRVYGVEPSIPKGENLYKSVEFKIGSQAGVVETYTSAPIGEDGYPLFDDGDRFFIRVLLGNKQYVIFAEERVQLGGPVATASVDANNVLHIEITDIRTAQDNRYDYIFNENEGFFERHIIKEEFLG